MDCKTRLLEVERQIANIQKATKLEELKKERVELQDKIHEMEQEVLVGTCWIFKDNSYSCPKSAKDKWDVYGKVVRKGVLLTVEKTSYGMIEVEEKQILGEPFGYVKIKEEAFLKQFSKMIAEIASNVRLS